jgi:hypothetical protein
MARFPAGIPTPQPKNAGLASRKLLASPLKKTFRAKRPTEVRQKGVAGRYIAILIEY